MNSSRLWKPANGSRSIRAETIDMKLPPFLDGPARRAAAFGGA